MRKFIIEDFTLLEYNLVKDFSPDINVDMGFTSLTLSQAKNKCKNLLTFYRSKEEEEGKKLKLRILPDTPWYDFLVDLFSTYHTEWSEKTGGYSIEYFYIDRTSYGKGRTGTPCFFFKLKDFTTDYDENHLGYQSLKKEHKSICSVLKSCRYAIREDIENFRKSETQKLKDAGLYDESAHYQVHHAGNSFNEISKEWIKLNGGANVLSQKVCPTIGYGYETKFLDENLNRSFREFHKENAILQLVTEVEHKKIHSA